jgi:acyl-coenzyme A thioesterase PaaI-like protein
MAFLRRPAAAAVVAEGRLLRMGRRLAFGDVLLYSEGVADPVAQASVTYAMPSEA